MSAVASRNARAFADVVLEGKFDSKQVTEQLGGIVELEFCIPTRQLGLEHLGHVFFVNSEDEDLVVRQETGAYGFAEAESMKVRSE